MDRVTHGHGNISKSMRAHPCRSNLRVLPSILRHTGLPQARQHDNHSPRCLSPALLEHPALLRPPRLCPWASLSRMTAKCVLRISPSALLTRGCLKAQPWRPQAAAGLQLVLIHIVSLLPSDMQCLDASTILADLHGLDMNNRQIKVLLHADSAMWTESLVQ